MPKCPPNLDAESKRIWTRLIDIMQDEGRRNHGKRGVACSGGVAEWMTWRRRASFSRPPSEFRSPAMRHPARSPGGLPGRYATQWFARSWARRPARHPHRLGACLRAAGYRRPAATSGPGVVAHECTSFDTHMLLNVDQLLDLCAVARPRSKPTAAKTGVYA